LAGRLPNQQDIAFVVPNPGHHGHLLLWIKCVPFLIRHSSKGRLGAAVFELAAVLDLAAEDSAGPNRSAAVVTEGKIVTVHKARRGATSISMERPSYCPMTDHPAVRRGVALEVGRAHRLGQM
jgi:hypothetical protein